MYPRDISSSPGISSLPWDLILPWDVIPPWDVQQALPMCPAQRKEKLSHMPGEEWAALDLSSFNIRILVKQICLCPQMRLGFFPSGKGKGRDTKAGMAAHNRADCWKSHCSLASPRFPFQCSTALSHPKPLLSEWCWSD